MTQKFFPVVVLLTCSFFTASAHAEWVVDKELYSLSGNTTETIRKVLTMTDDSGISQITRDNLTSQKPVKIKAASVSAALYRWENQADCKVPDPSSVKKIFAQNFSAAYDYYLEDGAAEPNLYWSIPLFKAPCVLQPGESAVSYQIKK